MNILESKLNLMKNISEYASEKSLVISENLVDKVLLNYKDLLEGICETCGGAFCMEECPVNRMLIDIDKQFKG